MTCRTSGVSVAMPSRTAARDGMATLTPLVAHVIAELSDLDAV